MNPKPASDYMPPEPYRRADLDEIDRILVEARKHIAEAMAENRRRKGRNAAGAIRKASQSALYSRRLMAETLKKKGGGA